jgi:hypothetical protein
MSSRSLAGVLKVLSYNLDLSGGIQALGCKKALITCIIARVSSQGHLVESGP